MPELFKRDFYMKVGSNAIPLQISNGDKIQNVLRVSFSAERTLSKDPNTASVTVYNLSPTNRKALQEGYNNLPRTPKGDVSIKGYEWPLTLEAGYVGGREVVFIGDIRFASSARSGVDWVSNIEAQDGGRQYTQARINKTFGPGSNVRSVLQATADALGVGLGNSAIKFASGTFRKGYFSFSKGVTLRGRASKVLDKYVTSTGYKWSIQEGQLQILEPKGYLLDVEVVLNVDTGLIGSPEQGEKDVVSAASLLNPSIKPGRVVNIQSEMINGRYVVERVTHTGDTWANTWYSQFEAKLLT